MVWLCCRKNIDAVVQKWGKIDILVNNAAFQGPAKESFCDIDRERLEFTFKTNILAYFSNTQLALKHMSEGSVIVNTCSIQAVMPMPGILDYASTKVHPLPPCFACGFDIEWTYGGRCARNACRPQQPPLP